MTPEQRAIADVLTFRHWWGDAWAFARLEQATRERAQERQRAQAAQMHRIAQVRAGSG
ncbi:MAG TPA: hypothetical protein VFN70_18110 [Burkholderiales bacterium]|nr:hypothetical protein [Burkholderiales bacterium]